MQVEWFVVFVQWYFVGSIWYQETRLEVYRENECKIRIALAHVWEYQENLTSDIFMW